ncbi:MAG TPA: XRE family transcriptional regulator [Pirellulales bacterium]|nr:XRE family transcriptional regulator [Pirellulales bacterium]
MNPVQKLAKVVKKRFPTAKCNLDPAENDAGSWFLDVGMAGHGLNVEWQPKRGFGLTARDDAVYGEGADEVYPELGAATRRVLWLLEHKSRTSPPLAAQLRNIRLKRRLTQQEIAKRLGTNQSSVSRLEARGENIGLRKLQELIAAMGGQLSLHVVFPESGDQDELSLGELLTGTYG